MLLETLCEVIYHIISPTVLLFSFWKNAKGSNVKSVIDSVDTKVKKNIKHILF